MGRAGIEEMYRTGLGKITSAARRRSRMARSSSTRFPFQVRKSAIVETIAEKVQSGEIDGVSDLRDESDREGLRVVVELKRSANPNVVLNQLFKFTPLEQTFSAIFLVIIDGNPRTLSLKEILNSFIDFRREVVRRRTEHRLDVAKKRAHILEGFRIALREHRSRDRRHPHVGGHGAAARRALCRVRAVRRAGRRDSQDAPVAARRRSKCEKIDAEYEEKLRAIADYEQLLGSEVVLDETIKRELREIAEKYPDARRTTIENGDGGRGLR